MGLSCAMRALQQTSFDGPRDLRVAEGLGVPVPGADEVLMRVGAAGVNFRDVVMAYGGTAEGVRPPYVAGFEGAGEVVGVGERVRGVEVGEMVVGVGYGAFAEFMTMAAGAVVRVPAGWTAAEALGLVVNWPTAIAALRPLGRIAAGETVLIRAAAGGTGQAAVRAAKHWGARVIATASVGKHEVVRGLGADHVLDARSGDLAAEVLRLTGGEGVDVVLESVGGESFGVGLAVAKRVTGRVVVFGLAGGTAALTNWELVYENQIQVMGLNIGVLAQRAPELFGEVMGELFGLIAAGVAPPGKPTVYDLADGAKALMALESGTTVGKLALVP
ncbi:zinc-binding dehydrogenase [Nocardia yamanashiensis]|uniref:zinc-binding dehydrogenase n=1 Tax=Nocardia yamanashiensis TaxID=209247 RepID=UPI00082D70C7